jgi:hypothetical protein
MRACFLGQNVCALGYGVALVQTPPLVEDRTIPPVDPVQPEAGPTDIAPLPNRMFEHLRRHLPHHS